ncbi:MAG TPA: SDR family oxidoreductase [Polyangiaceae bacterium]|nr:SDR family oxidoreductase [Polyangiaceae bacterium]
MPKSVLITGANRGLGESLVNRFAADGWLVFAGQRSLASSSTPVRDVSDRVTLLGLDVLDAASVARAAKKVSERTRGLDVLINNAAINPPGDGAALGELDFDAIRSAYEVNAIGPLRVTQAFVSLLERGERPLVVNVSSEAGSLQHSWRDKGFGYCMSKAALNMQTTMLHLALKPKGIDVISLHPGWMRTDMGGPNASLDPAESAEGMYRVVTSADANTPRFVQHDGKPFPW